MINIKEYWYNYPKNQMYCAKHNQLFHVGSSCELCVKENSIGLTPESTTQNKTNYSPTPVPPILPMENKKNKKGSPTPPPYDFGLTDRQLKALEMKEKGLSYSAIATTLNISKGTVQDLLKRAYGNAKKYSLTVKRPPLTISNFTPLTIRLHNDEFKIKVLADYINLNLEIINKGKNLEYKVIPFEDCKIKLHKNNTLTVRFLKDINAVDESECKRLADIRLNEFIKYFDMFGIKIIKSELINRHYGLLGSSFAKKVVDERKEIIIRDESDNKVRLRIDKSVFPAEIDAEHPIKNINDIGITKAYFDDLINKPHYTPSVVKEFIDMGLKIQMEYAMQIKRHLIVQDKTVIALEGINKGITELREVIVDMKQKEAQKVKEQRISKWIEENNLR